MALVKCKRVRVVKRIRGNREAEMAVRAAATRIQVITLNMDANGTDHDTYWALRDVYNNLMRVVNHTNYTLIKEAQNAE